MLEQLIYKNHMNETVEFGKNGLYANIGDLRDYSWNVTTKNNRVSSFGRKTVTRKLPVVIMCDPAETGIQLKNKLFEVVEKDVLAKQYGKLYIGNYYMKCYVTDSSKSDYLNNKRYVELDLKLTTDMPYWIKESTVSAGVVDNQNITGLDFAFDYPYDFTSAFSNLSINNTGFVSSNFKIIIYGPCSNPTITIGEHMYQVSCTVNNGEYLTIDSVSKEIFTTTATGTIVNNFNNRNKASYVFEKIPPGKSSVSWNGSFGFDIVLLEERSEPKWT